MLCAVSVAIGFVERLLRVHSSSACSVSPWVYTSRDRRRWGWGHSMMFLKTPSQQVAELGLSWVASILVMIFERWHPLHKKEKVPTGSQENSWSCLCAGEAALVARHFQVGRTPHHHLGER